MKIIEALLVALLLAASATLVPVSAQQAPVPANAGQRTLVFDVQNMTCPLCPVTVRKAIERVAGVVSVTADLDTRSATVVFDPTVTGAEEIAAASRDAGYPATAVGDGG